MPDEEYPKASDLVSKEVRDAISGLQVSLIERAQKLVDGIANPHPPDNGGGGVVDARSILVTLLGALAGQTANQQGSQQAVQQATEQLAALTGRTQTETSHTEDINAPERQKATVARGTDNNEIISQRINTAGANVADMASVAVGVLMTTTSASVAQIQAQIPDLGMKNSDNGRLVQDCVKSGHGDCRPCYAHPPMEKKKND